MDMIDTASISWGIAIEKVFFLGAITDTYTFNHRVVRRFGHRGLFTGMAVSYHDIRKEYPVLRLPESAVRICESNPEEALLGFRVLILLFFRGDRNVFERFVVNDLAVLRELSPRGSMLVFRIEETRCTFR